MKSKLLEQTHGRRVYMVVLDTGEEAMSTLLDFVREERMTAAQVTAIGAFSDAVLFFFDWEKKEYLHRPIAEQTEVASLVGDVALGEDGEPMLHLHVVLGTRDCTALAGHLSQARVRPTLEVMLSETPAHLQRVEDRESGLALIRAGG
ncbi:MAG: PPC domain-containing DNA-binding protein [Hyphomicrobiales bacterium]